MFLWPFLLFLFCNLGRHPVHGHLSYIASRLPLPGTPPRPGSPWPQPNTLSLDDTYASISGRDLTFLSDVTCPILSTAFGRYDATFLFRDLPVTPSINTPILSQVRVVIPQDQDLNLCNQYPKLSRDPNHESYTINISRLSDAEASATITATTVWGALHGIESFSQLIWNTGRDNHFVVNFTDISDAPRYPHRGFMMDTARHYVDLPVIQTVLDGMSYNKLNVFHWHLVDDQSFPFVSRRFPELSEKGAYLPELTYEPEEVQGIIDYARDRGIRVVLEFDTPGHTQGFGKAFPEILTPCYGDGLNPGTPYYPNHSAYEILDPTRNITFEIMEEFFTEIKDVTRDEYVHLGMDEAYRACWNSSPEIWKFMSENNWTDLHQLEGYYVDRHLNMIKGLGLKSIIWHDPITFDVEVPNDVLIQVWKGGYTNGTPSVEWVPFFQRALELNHTTILSSCWYLNYISYGGANSSEWKLYYECDPILSANITDEHQKSLVLGGEAACWGEYVDGTNVLTRVFPLIGAMAERLWSTEFPIDNQVTDDAWHRLDQHRCRMLWRGLPAQPLYNGYCFAQEKTGLKKSHEKSGAGFGSFSGTLLLLVVLFQVMTK